MAREISFYEVIVGNIGTVYRGNSKVEALKKYSTYVKASKSSYGRASGEGVDLFKDGDVIKSHVGRISNPSIGKKISCKAVRFNKNGSVTLFK